MVPGELQPYHEGVSLGAERVGEPVDGEGQVGHHVEVAALHSVLQKSRTAQRSRSVGDPSQQGGGPRAFPPPLPSRALTTPSTGVAPR